MTAIIEIPTEDLAPHETGRVELTSSSGTRMRFSRTKAHPFHIAVSVSPPHTPPDLVVPVCYFSLDMLRDTGVYCTSLAVQMTNEWHRLTPDQQSEYMSRPVLPPSSRFVLIDRDDLQYLISEIRQGLIEYEVMLDDPVSRQAMYELFSEEDVEQEMDRMRAIIARYGND